jgi:hypothetical protein
MCSRAGSCSGSGLLACPGSAVKPLLERVPPSAWTCTPFNPMARASDSAEATAPRLTTTLCAIARCAKPCSNLCRKVSQVPHRWPSYAPSVPSSVSPPEARAAGGESS